MKYTGPKTRLCRREGINLFSAPKYQKIMTRRPGVPGMHGTKRMAKLSEYGRQLREKQKLKRTYGLSEKQFFRYVDAATRKKGITHEILIKALESRLDNVIFRSGLALTRAQARQFASHGIFLLNGRRIDIPSIEVKPGDMIEVRSTKKDSPIFHKIREEIPDHKPPQWLNVDISKRSITIQDIPDTSDIEASIESRLIIEFYSR